MYVYVADGELVFYLADGPADGVGVAVFEYEGDVCVADVYAAEVEYEDFFSAEAWAESGDAVDHAVCHGVYLLCDVVDTECPFFAAL